MPADSFVGLDSLTILDLSKNKIQRIENGTFVIKTLQILKLSDNRISNITENAFETLASLETLLLDRNKLENIPSRLFYNISCLTYLDLSNNNLLSVSKINIMRYMKKIINFYKINLIFSANGHRVRKSENAAQSRLAREFFDGATRLYLFKVFETRETGLV